MAYHWSVDTAHVPELEKMKLSSAIITLITIIQCAKVSSIPSGLRPVVDVKTIVNNVPWYRACR